MFVRWAKWNRKNVSEIYLVCFVRSKRSKNDCQTKDWNQTHTRTRTRRYELCSLSHLLARRLPHWLAGWLMCVRVHLSIWLAMNRRKLVENQNKRLSHLGISEWRCLWLLLLLLLLSPRCTPPKSLSNIVVYLLWELCNKTSALSNSRTPRHSKEKTMTNATTVAGWQAGSQAAVALATTRENTKTDYAIQFRCANKWVAPWKDSNGW